MLKIKQVNLLESLPFEEIAETSLEGVAVIYEEIMEEKRSVEITESDMDAPILEERTADKAAIALQRAIAKKKAEEKRRDDESQTKLF